MRQEHETVKSFNELKAITQAIMLKKGAQKNATHQESERTQASHNANAFTTEQTNNSSLKTEPSDEALKQGLENTQSKGSEHEAY
ncbi:hypothetical protein [Helicobacter pylori]|uniref:hypothetical protein n=1 Tax=Helicobacter pylori TaxID=210 RepID=UPI000992A5A8|nr:hypothetical protein [Helicobacter pylori]